jgi:hypothetical protein
MKMIDLSGSPFIFRQEVLENIGFFYELGLFVSPG